MPFFSIPARNWNSVATLALIVILVATTGFVLHTTQSGLNQSSEIQLPIEVMHGDVFGEHPGNEALAFHGGNSPRHIKSVTFEVSSGGGELWLWGHHIGFQYFGDWFAWDKGQGNFNHAVSSSYDAPFDGRAKAAVRINGGDWIDLTSDNVTCATTEEAQGCIGGIASSTRLKVNGTELRTGANSVEFAFLGHDMLTSGYRILDIAALPQGYSGSLSHRDVRPLDQISTPKVEADPSNWTEPQNSSVARGRDLWHNAELADWPGSGNINATCNACHAEDGRDLKFFNYSNESIIARSEHHGLSEQEGRDIAAYIRSRMLRMADGTTYEAPGRPWNPPYQPGPRGFGPDDEHPDVAPAQYWSAGAGLEWIADDEEEVLPYIFPDGTSNHDAGPFVRPGVTSINRERLDYDGEYFNMREVPLSIQMPDWNRWLPIIHPADAYGPSYFQNTNTWQEYLDARNEIPALRASNNQGAVSIRMRRTANSGRDELARYAPPTINEGSAWNRYRERSRRGSQQWLAVKQWELHHEYDLEGWFYEQDSSFENRTWGHDQRTIFDIASHISGHTGFLDGPPGGSGGWLSHVWYYLQAIVNAGNGPQKDASQLRPVDWKYQVNFSRAHDSTGLPSYTRWLTTWVKLNETLARRDGLHIQRGFMNRTNSLFDLYRFHGSEQLAGSVPREQVDLLIDTVLKSWMRTVNELGNPTDFPQTDVDVGGSDRNYWGHPDDVPTVQHPSMPAGRNNYAVRNHYNTLRILNQSYSLSPSVVGDLARWGSEMWADPPSDHIQWHEFEGMATGPPAGSENSGQSSAGMVVEFTSPDEDTSVHVNGEYTVSAEVDLASDVTLSRLAIYADDVLIDEASATELSAQWIPEESGDVQLVAVAENDDGIETESYPVIVTVTPEPRTLPENSAYSHQILTLNPIEYWRFESNSDDFVPGEKGVHDAILYDDASLSSGIIGTGLKLENSAYAEIPHHNDLNLTGSLSLSFWFNIDQGWGSESWTHLIGKGNQTFQIRRHQNNEELHFDLRGGSGDYAELITEFAPSPKTWYHIVAIYDQNQEEMRVYIDGTQDPETTERKGTIASTEDPLQLGANLSSEGTHRRFFEGKIDEVAIFDRALSPTEVEELYESTYDELDQEKVTPSLLAHTAAEVEEAAATLKGEIGEDDSSQSLDVWFEYKETESVDWNQTSQETAVPGDTVATTINNLSGGTSYDYRLVSKIDNNEVTSSTERFVTINAPEVVSQQLKLTSGWNLISSWITPEAKLIEDVLEDILPNIVLVKNGDGETFIPEYDINDIQEWDPTASYMIFMLDEDQIEVTGTPFDPSSQSFSLGAGWNQIAYPISTKMAPASAFESIISEVVIVKDYAGEAFIPEYEIDNINDLHPGKGYRVFTAKEVDLEFPTVDSTASEPSLVANTESNSTIASNNSDSDRRGVAASATVILDNDNLPVGATIQVISSSGQVIGNAPVEGDHSAIRVMGTDGQQSSGAQTGETLTLRIQSEKEGEQELSIEHVSAVVGETISDHELAYQEDGVFLVEAQPGPSELILEGSYPNPVDQLATIEYGLPEDTDVRIDVFDMLGRRVTVLVDEHQQAGFHEVQINAQNLSSGVYVYRISTDSRSLTDKFTVVR